MAHYEYFININERDRFGCDVRDTNGKTVWEFWVEADELEHEMEGVPMEYPEDVAGLLDYLIIIDVLQPGDTLALSN